MSKHLIVKSQFLIFISLFLLSSCITNRDLEYIRSNKEVSKIKVDQKEYVLQTPSSTTPTRRGIT